MTHEQAIYINKTEEIKNNPVYKQILKDSFGGVMYDVANQDKYDTAVIVELYNDLAPNEKDSVGGIMKGAINFVTGKQ